MSQIPLRLCNLQQFDGFAESADAAAG